MTAASHQARLVKPAVAAAVPGREQFGGAGEDREHAGRRAAADPGDREEEVVEHERREGQCQDPQCVRPRRRTVAEDDMIGPGSTATSSDAGRPPPRRQQADPYLRAQRRLVAAGHREERDATLPGTMARNDSTMNAV